MGNTEKQYPVGTRFFNSAHSTTYEIISYDAQGQATTKAIDGPAKGAKWQGYLTALHQMQIIYKPQMHKTQQGG